MSFPWPLAPAAFVGIPRDALPLFFLFKFCGGDSGFCFCFCFCYRFCGGTRFCGDNSRFCGKVCGTRSCGDNIRFCGVLLS
jgi:hypothetical protein